MKVTTKDFQSLKGENTFEFPVGITIIQGKTDSGKSTVFYAIQDCLENPSGVSDVINWDAKSAEVIIENDGGWVKWIKTNTSSEYVDKNGKPYVKASKLDSRDIDNLGFYFDKKGNVVNIHNEWDKIFPFESSDSEMFKLFEDMFNISSSFQIIDSIKKEEQEVKNAATNVKTKIDSYHQSNSNIDNILSQIDVNKIDCIISDLQNLETKVKDISSDFTTFSNNQYFINMIIPDILDTNSLNNNSATYCQIIQDYDNFLTNSKYCQIELPQVKQFDIKENIYANDYQQYQNVLNQLQSYDNELALLDKQEIALKEQLKGIKVCPTCGRPLED